ATGSVAASTSKAAANRGEIMRGTLYRRFVRRGREKAVDRSAILASEAVRRSHAVDLLRRSGDRYRHPLLARGVDREPEILRHQIGHEAGRIIAAGAAVRVDAGDRVVLLHDPGRAGRSGDDLGEHLGIDAV